MLRLLSKRQGFSSFLSRCRYFSVTAGDGDASSAFAVMSFGDGSQGALGLPSSLIGVGADAYEPALVPGLPPDVVSVSAGHYHSLAVTAKGELWAWGRNDEGQLGRGLLAPRTSWNEPQKVDGLENVQVRAAFASGVISVAVSDDGSMWTWGRSKRGQLGLGKDITEAVVPSKVEALSEEDIVKVSLGWGHVLAQTSDGKLFGWGYSADGRLGRLGGTVSSPLDSEKVLHNRCEVSATEALEVAEKLVLESMEKEKDMPILWEPHVIEVPSLKVTDFSCGLDHSLVICGDGTLLSGGSNIYGQLGRQNPAIGLHPVDLSFHPLHVSCGLGHSLAICKKPTSEDSEDYSTQVVVSWGWNQRSQLGRAGPEGKPMIVTGLDDEEIPKVVSGGRVHSLAVTTKGELWVWGCGKNGRLGLGCSIDEPEPVLVDIEGYKVVQAVSGFDHTLLLVAES